MKQIDSIHNDHIKHIVRLRQSPTYQKKHSLCIVEGLRAIETWITSQHTLTQLHCTQETKGKALQLAQPESITVLSNAAMRKASDAVTPSGLLALFHIHEQPVPIPWGPGLVLAQIQDPGNAGTLIRSAMALNYRLIICIESVNPWNSKVVQASAGTIAHAYVYHMSWDELKAKRQDVALTGLVPSSGASPHALADRDHLFVIGNEGRGIPNTWLPDCDYHMTLAMPGQTESLNAGVAGSIALYLYYYERIR